MPTRRQFVLGIAAVAGGLYINHRGLRYPRLSFETDQYPQQARIDDVRVTANDVFAVPLGDTLASQESDVMALRAFAPEPDITFEVDRAQDFTFLLNNLADNARLKVRASGTSEVQESIEGITRKLQIKTKGADKVSLQWLLPNSNGVDFAVIGDTGAGLELEWCLHRASEMGAQFLLHLGDFNYQPGEYQRAIELFNTSPIPCYISIGNHDFNDSGLIHDKFITHLGPLNHEFTVAGTQFINIDSALNFFPAYAGQRGHLLDQIAERQRRMADVVCFTHRNFLDPRPGEDHTMSGVRERPWLANKLQACGADHLLSGHVHHSAELEYRGMKQWIVGEGLGFEDIVHEKLISKMLMGHAEAGNKVRYQWRDLNMPWAMHTSPEHEEKLLKEHPHEKLEWYRQKLATSQRTQI